MNGLAPVTRTVLDAMVTTPVTHPPDTTVLEATAALENPHRHLVLVVDDGRLLATLDRQDLLGVAPCLDPALAVARLSGHTARADDDLATVHAAMVVAHERRRAVVDDQGRLLGLLCLKRDGSGFCTDEGVRARSLARGHRTQVPAPGLPSVPRPRAGV